MASLKEFIVNAKNMLPVVTGRPDWLDTPSIDLEETRAHVEDTGNPHAVTFAQAVAIEDAAGTVTDSHIGARTANQTIVPTIDIATLTTWLSWFVNRIKALSGEADWKTNPQTTLSAAAVHQSDADNPHGVTTTQIGAMDDTHPANPITGFGQSALALVGSQSPGIATTVSRGDHQHPRPSAPEVGAMANTHAANAITGFGVLANVLASFQSPGSATTVSRSDHKHPYPTAVQIGAAAQFGDVNNVFNASNFRANQSTGYGFVNSSGSFTMDASNGGVRVPAGGGFHVRNTSLQYVWCYASKFEVTPSNRVVKNKIEDVKDCTARIRRLQPMRFRYKWESSDDQPHLGFAAEDLEQVAPDAVSQSKEINEDGDPVKAIDYGVISTMAWQAIRELDARLSALEAAQ